MNPLIFEKFFPGSTEKIKQKICPICGEYVGKFEDELSKKEYKISGMCQECQNEVFKNDKY